MPLPQTKRAAFIEGLKQADRARRELKLDSEVWIDPYAGILQTDAVFMLRPLDGLYGAFIPRAGTRPGILVNSKHPLALQRFTAAHELGHLWMGHGESLDTEEEILRLGNSATPIEVAANTFSSFLLMPRARVEERIAELRFSKRLLDPRAPYILSLWFGVSYSAMVWHLSTLKHITTQNAEELAQVTPKSIKAKLLSGDVLADPWADVFPLGPAANSQTIVSRVGDELAITLPSHAPAGYLWASEDFKADALRLTTSKELPNKHADELIGVSPKRRLVIRLLEQGKHTLHLAERRPFSRQGKPAAEFTIDLIVVAKPEAGLVEQPLLPRQVPA
jgi:Zn-dependent peptidase ImmA (M78 family)/predicted secreted protein